MIAARVRALSNLIMFRRELILWPLLLWPLHEIRQNKNNPTTPIPVNVIHLPFLEFTVTVIVLFEICEMKTFLEFFN